MPKITVLNHKYKKGTRSLGLELVSSADGFIILNWWWGYTVVRFSNPYGETDA